MIVTYVKSAEGEDGTQLGAICRVWRQHVRCMSCRAGGGPPAVQILSARGKCWTSTVGSRCQQPNERVREFVETDQSDEGAGRTWTSPVSSSVKASYRDHQMDAIGLLRDSRSIFYTRRHETYDNTSCEAQFPRI